LTHFLTWKEEHNEIASSLTKTKREDEKGKKDVKDRELKAYERREKMKKVPASSNGSRGDNLGRKSNVIRWTRLVKWGGT